MIQRTIGEFRLSITPDGCIEHLGLAPGDLAETVILVNDSGTANQVSRYFDGEPHRKSHGGFNACTGFIGVKKISVVAMGTGTANIDIVLNELDALLNIDFDAHTPYEIPKHLNIIRLGICKVVQPDIVPGSMVAATFGIGLDNLLHYYRYENNAEETFLLHAFQQHSGLSGYPLQPYIAEGAVRLRNHFTEGFIHGIFITSPGFYAPQGRRLRLAPAHTHLADILQAFTNGSHRIIGYDMETAAMYGLGKLLGHHCISINTIIDDTTCSPYESMANMIQKILSGIVRF